MAVLVGSGRELEAVMVEDVDECLLPARLLDDEALLQGSSRSGSLHGDCLAGATVHGNVHTMITTIDAAGRLVIPGPIRREAALEPGVPLEVRWRDGIIEIEPQPIPVVLEPRGRLLVARPKIKVRPLGAATVERARRDISTGRGRR